MGEGEYFLGGLRYQFRMSFCDSVLPGPHFGGATAASILLAFTDRVGLGRRDKHPCSLRGERGVASVIGVAE